MLQPPSPDAGSATAGSGAEPGLSVVAVRNGRVVFTTEYGFDRLEEVRAADARTVYNIASVTKQFTAACVLLLREEGALDVDDPVARYLPGIPHADVVTLRHLLTHSSGYVDYYPLGFADDDKLYDSTPDDIIARYASLPLQFAPGGNWSYSNTGFHILGRVIETVSGASYDEFLTEKILRPVGMTQSFFNDPPEVTEAHALGYTRFALGPIRRARSERAGWMYASGGIASTAGNLAAWSVAFMAGSVLDRSSFALMTEEHPLADGTLSPAAMGWFVEHHGGETVLLHSGGLAGFASQIVLHPPSQSGVVVLSNGDYVPVATRARALFAKIGGFAIPPPPAPTFKNSDATAALAEWTRRFQSSDLPRNEMTDTMQWYLTSERIEDARAGLGTLGNLEDVQALAAGERGAMSWVKARVTFQSSRADVLVRLTAEGKLAEFAAYPCP